MQVLQKGSEDDVYLYEGQPKMTRNCILPVRINFTRQSINYWQALIRPISTAVVGVSLSWGSDAQ
jgi:hypothetical protein